MLESVHNHAQQSHVAKVVPTHRQRRSTRAVQLDPACRQAAAYKPVVFLRGANHAQLSNGMLREGDLEPELDDAAATQGAARIIGSFVAAHMSPDRCGAVRTNLRFCGCAMCMPGQQR